MLKFFTFFNFANLKQMVVRFPVPVVVIVVLTLLFLWLHNGEIPNYSMTMEFLEKSTFSLILVFFFSIGVSFAVASRKFSSVGKLLFQFIPLVFWVFFYFHLDRGIFDIFNTNTLSLILGFVGVLALLFFAPYLMKLTIPNHLYYQYFLHLVQLFLFGAVLGGLLSGLGALAILAVELLFDVGGNFLEDFVSNWVIVALSFLTPLVCLMKLPKIPWKQEDTFALDTFTTVIIKYVLTSFVCLCFIILYAYTVKVLAHFTQRPTGEVCWLVVAFSIVGYVWYLFSFYLEKDVKFLQVLRKRFPLVMLPQMGMLFYAIGLRIQQYDITVARYLMVVFGVWLVVLSVYFFFSQQKRLLMLPMSLLVFTLLISFWPWSVFSLPETRQLARLQENLWKAGLLVATFEEGQMVPLQSGRAITKELSYQIFDGMRYLCGNFDCEKVAQLFGKEMGSKTMWGMINEIATEFGLKNSYFVRDIPVALSIDVAEESVFPIDVEGYEYVVRIDGEVGELRVKVDVVENAVHLSDGQRLKETIFLDDLQSQIYGALVARYGTPTAYGNELPKEVLTFEGKGEKYAVKLYLESLRMKNPEYVWDERGYFYVSGYALVREV